MEFSIVAKRTIFCVFSHIRMTNHSLDGFRFFFFFSLFCSLGDVTWNLPTIFLAGSGKSMPDIRSCLCSARKSLYRLVRYHEFSFETPLWTCSTYSYSRSVWVCRLSCGFTYQLFVWFSIYIVWRAFNLTYIKEWPEVHYIYSKGRKIKYKHK